MRKAPHFGVEIVWGTIPSGPRFSELFYGKSPNLWVQKKLVKFWQRTQDTWLCFAKFLREFLSYFPFDLLGDLGDVILSWFRVKYALCSTASTALRRFSRNCANFLLFLNVAILLRKNSCQWWRPNLFYLWLSIMVSSKSEGKRFQRNQTVKMIFMKSGTIPKSYHLYNNNCTFISPIFTFSWWEL